MGHSGNILLLTFLYFIQGLPYGFQAHFLPLHLRDNDTSLTNVGFFKILLAPWLCKALWAPLVDKYSTKQKWLLYSIGGLIITCLLASLITPTNVPFLCGVILLLNICAATQDIAVDSIAVAILTPSELGEGNIAQVVGYKVGSIFGGGVLVWLHDLFGWRVLFLMLTALYVEAAMFVYLSPSLRNFNKRSRRKAMSFDGDHSDMTESDTSFSRSNSSISVFDHEGVLEQEEGSRRLSDEIIMEQNESFEAPDVTSKSSLDEKSECLAENVPPKRSKSDLEENVQDNNIHEQIHVLTSDFHKTPADVRWRLLEGGSARSARMSKEALEAPITACQTSRETLVQLNSENSTFLRNACEGGTSTGPAKRNSLLVGVLAVPGTKWTMVYLLVYKLGEQGALGMLPMFLVDQKVNTQDVTFWTAVVGQAISVVGSFAAGCMLSKYRCRALPMLQMLTTCRLIPMGFMLLVIVVWKATDGAQTDVLFAFAIVAMNFLLFISGLITTTTFTLMMQCSQNAQSSIQATHYTSLATIEVFGKLTFMSLSGWLVDRFGYSSMFLIFVVLSVALLPWLKKCPQVLSGDIKEKKS